MTHGKTYNKSPRRINHKATKSKTNTGTTALERSVEETTAGFKALLQLANFTLGPDSTLNTEIHKNSVRTKAPNSVNASKRKHKNQINRYNKQRRVLMANSTVCQRKWKPVVEPRRAKPKTYRQAPTHWVKVLRRGRHWVWGPNRRHRKILVQIYLVAEVFLDWRYIFPPRHCVCDKISKTPYED